MYVYVYAEKLAACAVKLHICHLVIALTASQQPSSHGCMAAFFSICVMHRCSRPEGPGLRAGAFLQVILT